MRKRRAVGRMYGIKYSGKGHKDRNRPKNKKRSGQARLVYVKDINEPALPTPFYSVLVSISVFMALSTVFYSINSSDSSPFSHSVLPVLALPFNNMYIFYESLLQP